MSENEKVAGQRIGDAYRRHAGLPERTGDEPMSNGDPSGKTPAYEPEGGYGGEDGISNVGALNASEAARAEQREEKAEESADDELTGGETATEEARVTGDDTVDVKPGSGEHDENQEQ